MAHIMMTGASAAVVPRCKGSSFTVDAQSLKRVVRREDHIPRWCSGGLRASLSETHSCRGRAHQSALQAALSQPAGGNFSAAETEVTTQHVLSVFVTDEAALINHVSQIFNDAGLNIDSLAVGLNVNTALFTITVTCTPALAADVLEQVSALQKVLYVESLTSQDRVERELVLIRVRLSSADSRTEVTQLARIYGASVVDASDNFLTLVATGGAAKTEALQLNLRSHGIAQLCRTGKVSLKRGNQLLDVTARVTSSFDEVAGSDFLAASPVGATASGSASQIPQEAAPSNTSSRVGSEPTSNGTSALQDYSALLSNSNELWQAKQAVDEDGATLGVLEDSHTLSIEVADTAGTLLEVTRAFANINVQSLAVGASETAGRSRITMVVPRDDEGLSTLIQQIADVPCVGSIRDLTDSPFVTRELMIVKVQCQPSERGTIKDIADIFHGKIIDVSHETMILELQGREEKMIAAQGLLKEFGVLEVARTGRVALPRDSGIDTSLLSRVQGKVSWRKQSANGVV